MSLLKALAQFGTNKKENEKKKNEGKKNSHTTRLMEALCLATSTSP